MFVLVHSILFNVLFMLIEPMDLTENWTAKSVKLTHSSSVVDSLNFQGGNDDEMVIGDCYLFNISDIYFIIQSWRT